MISVLDNKILERIVRHRILTDNEFRKEVIIKSVKSSFSSQLSPVISENNFKNFQVEVKILHSIPHSARPEHDISMSFEATFLIPERKPLQAVWSLSIDERTYLQFKRELVLQEMEIEQEDKIRGALTEYLEFNSDELFQNSDNIVRVFGGAIRDIIAEQPINDIDILIGTKAIKSIEMILERRGYHFMEKLASKDLHEMYSEIHVINEPHTWIKGTKVVQLIRPAIGFQCRNEEVYRQGFLDLISNVDLSCCGVSYDGKKLSEDFQGAVIHCQSKVFSVNKGAKMYSDKRIHLRKEKLISRGWKEVENTITNNRDLKLENLL